MTRRSLMLSAAFGGAVRAARVESVEVISKQPRSYHAWATMARRANGELVASYSGGREGHICPFGRVELIRSQDSGRTWSWPTVLMDTPIDDRDSGILETARGSLLVTTFTSIKYEEVMAAAKGWETDRMERWQAVQRASTQAERQSLRAAWMLRSVGGGHSWSPPYLVPVTSPHGPIKLSDGRLLYPGREYPEIEGKVPRIGVCESKDDGLTWQWLAQIPTRPGDSAVHYHELHGVEAAPGKLIVHLRNHNPANERETLQSESNDGGRTWTAPRPIGVWGLPSHLIRLRDGRLLMSYGYRRPPQGNHARISEDQGKTWSQPIVLSDDGTGDIGYPSTVELPDGTLLTLWYESKRSGTVAVKLPDPPFSVLRLARWRIS